MQVDELELLVAIVDDGSLSAAARRLGISTAMVSRRLGAMERRLGTRLVARSTRSLRATDEGAGLVDKARGILAALREAEDAVRTRGRELSGPIRVIAPISFGRRRIAPLLGAFCATHPNLQLDLSLADRTVDMIEGGYDLQLSIGQPLNDSLVSRRLLNMRRAVCAAPSYWARFGMPETPDDLQGRECLVLRRGMMVLDRWNFRTPTGSRQVRVAGRLSSNSGEVTQAWALAGLGVILKSLWDVEEDLASGALVEVFADAVDERADIYACYPSRQYLPERVRALLDFLVTELRSAEKGAVEREPAERPPSA